MTPAEQIAAELEAAVSIAIGRTAMTVPSTDWINGYAAGARTAMDACVKALIVYRGLPTTGQP